MTTSKKIVLASYISAVTLTLIVIAGTFFNFEMSNVTTIASLAWGEVAVSNAFYFKKAARENAIKIAGSLPSDIQPSIDYNSIVNSN